jgi:hypothetical protein
MLFSGKVKSFIYETSKEYFKMQFVNTNMFVLFTSKSRLYLESHINPMNILCGVNTERFAVKAGGSYTNQCALNG